MDDLLNLIFEANHFKIWAIDTDDGEVSYLDESPFIKYGITEYPMFRIANAYYFVEIDNTIYHIKNRSLFSDIFVRKELLIELEKKIILKSFNLI